MAAPLLVELFGSMHVRIDGRALPRLRSRKALWLLALLTLRAGRPVEREWLAGSLWPDANRGEGLANLRPVISELRRALGPEGGRLRMLDRSSVFFDVEDAEIDVLRFDAAVAEGDDATVVAVHRRPLLSGCMEEWCPQERSVREEACLAALQRLGEASMLAQDPLQAAALFTRACEIAPRRAAPRTGLMSALALAGDLDSALRAYRDYIFALSGEAGEAPDPQTRELYLRLSQEARGGTERAVAFSPSTARVFDSTIPRLTTELLGREDERSDAAAALRCSRLVTLTGMGGMGKMRLALAAAIDVEGEFPDGVWFVDVEPEKSAVSALAAALDLSGRDPRGLEQLVSARLRGKRALIVLNGDEPLGPAGTSVANMILQECEEVRVLASHQEPLRVEEEHVLPVPPLATPNPDHLPRGATTRIRVMMGYEGVRLFVNRAQSVAPTFRLDGDNATIVAAICARLEGIPLAIELVASHADGMDVARLAERLTERLAPSASGRSGLGRRQTVRLVLDWTHDLLGQEEKRLFRRLSVFPGGWTREQAEEAMRGNGAASCEAVDLLDSLLAKCLVMFDTRRSRYRFSGTVRRYAYQRLQAAGEAHATDPR